MGFGKWHGAPAAINDEIHAFVFVVNDNHLAIAKYMVDLHIAMDMQDNPDIQSKIGAAHRGSDHVSEDSDDEHDDDVPKRKAKRTKSSSSIKEFRGQRLRRFRGEQRRT